ncbi:MAG: alpha/beta hydrolase [Bacteroidota bacterium]
MNFIESHYAPGDTAPVKLYYTDQGEGTPIVFIHGWPSDSGMWEYQIAALSQQGFRCIAYDRRGFGKSDKPVNGHTDYNVLAADLKAVLEGLDLENVTLVGFSMGAGEVVRYFSRFGGARVAKAIIIGGITPFMLQTNDNPDGTPKELFDTFVEQINTDRQDFLRTFYKQFYGETLINSPVSQAVLDWSWHAALLADHNATIGNIRAFSETDFRREMESVNVPCLIIHGDNDKVVPIKPAGQNAARLVPQAEYLVYEGAPHGLFITHKEKLNADLLGWITEGTLFSNREADDIII